MSFWYDVVVNLFAGLVAGVVSSALAYSYLRVLEWRRARRLWLLTDPANLTVIVSTSDGGEVPLPRASGLDAASVDALYVFVQAAVAAGEIAAPEAPKGEDAEAAPARPHSRRASRSSHRIWRRR